MTEKKMTRAQAIELAMAVLTEQAVLTEDKQMNEATEVLGKMLTSITKPRVGSGKPSKAHEQNVRLATKVLGLLPQGKGVTCGWIGEQMPEIPCNPTTGKVSTQKVAAIMRILVEAGKVVKGKEGKVVTYTLI